MSTKSGFVHILLITVIAIAAVVGVILVSSNRFSNLPQPSTSSAPQDTTRNSSEKTYTDKSNLFSFSYPSELSIREESSSNAQYIHLENNSQHIRLDILSSSFASRLKAENTLTFNTIKWNKYPKSNYCDAGLCGDTPITYQTKRDGTYYSFNLLQYEDTEMLESRILSSFEFTN